MTFGLTKSFILDNIRGCIQSPAQPNPAVWHGATCENSQQLRLMAVFLETFSSMFGWVLNESLQSLKELLKSFLFLFPSDNYCSKLAMKQLTFLIKRFISFSRYIYCWLSTSISLENRTINLMLQASNIISQYQYYNF